MTDSGPHGVDTVFIKVYAEHGLISIRSAHSFGSGSLINRSLTYATDSTMVCRTECLESLIRTMFHRTS